MKVLNPQQFLDKLDDKTFSNIKEKFGSNEKFLGPGDKFRFTCDRSGRCCKNRFDNPILLSPYDVYRLQENLKINSEEFADNYGLKILGSDSELPIMLLKYVELNNSNNKCVFLTPEGCRTYNDRPLVCRMYPVGRIIDTEMNSYFFLTKTADYCQSGKGKEHTIEEWLKKAEVEPYFEWNDRYHALYMQIDYKKYHSLDLAYKATFGEVLYDFDVAGKIFKGEIPEDLNVPGDNSGPYINYRLAKMYVERFLK